MPVRRPEPQARTTIKTVGAGLPAKAVCQSLKVVADPPLSQASQLPHFAMYSKVGTGLIRPLKCRCGAPNHKPEQRSKLWELACPRKRCASH
ncbi:hypothetical protein DXV65_25360 [Pseudomonas fluorescens]|nr:hypothetical protein DXV65_25360 [Pseudomonas fluorescens]